MSTRTLYRVTVIRETWADGDDGETYESETLLDLASPVPSRLAVFAPSEVALTLDPNPEDVTGSPAPAEHGPTDAPAPEGTKRKRRTKAEIAADKAREETVQAELRALSEPAPEAIQQTDESGQTYVTSETPTAPDSVPAAAPFNPFAPRR